MPALYVLQALLVAAALTIAGAAYPRLTGLSFAARGALGLTLTPPVLGLLTLAIAFAWPSAPRAAFMLIPGALGGAALIAMRARMPFVLAGARAAYARWRHNPRGRWMVQAGCLAVLVFVAAAIVSVFGEPTGHDALIYLTEARVFAEARNIAAIPGFNAAIGHVVKAEPHLFLWHAYLAQGLMATDGPVGYGHDLLARVSIQTTFALMPLSTLVLGRAVTPARTVWLAPVILLTFRGIQHVPAAYDIEGFRSITLLAFITLAVSGLGRDHKWTAGRIVLLGALCGIAAAAHTLDIFFVGLVATACLLLAFSGLIRWRNLLLAALACMVSLVPVAIPYIQNWLTYHSVFGAGMYYLSYQGTPLWQAFQHQSHWTRTVNIGLAFGIFLWQYGIVTMSAAILGSIALVAAARRDRAMVAAAGLGGLLLLCIFVLILPVGSSGGLQGAVLSNDRYGVPLCPVAAAVVCALLAMAFRYRAAFPIFPRWVVTGCKAIASIFVLASVAWLMAWSTRGALVSRTRLQEEFFITAKVAHLPSAANWATDNYAVAYFSGRPPLFLYSQAARPILAARGEADVRAFLRTNDIRLFAFNDKAPDWWPSTPLYKVLTGTRGIRQFATRRWQIFLLPDPAGVE